MGETLGEGGRGWHSLHVKTKQLQALLVVLAVCARVCVCKDEIKSRSPSWLLALPLISFGLSPWSSY